MALYTVCLGNEFAQSWKVVAAKYVCGVAADPNVFWLCVSDGAASACLRDESGQVVILMYIKENRYRSRRRWILRCLCEQVMAAYKYKRWVRSSSFYFASVVSAHNTFPPRIFKYILRNYYYFIQAQKANRTTESSTYNDGGGAD